MCLAIPMELMEQRAGDIGVVAIGGMRREVNLMLVEDPRPGDFMIVHAGFAIEKLDRVEAEKRLVLFAELAELERGQEA